jgi:putative hydrolase
VSFLPFEDDDAMMRFLAMFGITPGPDGSIDPNQLMSHLQQLMSNYNTQMAGYGPSDPAGINWNFTLDIAKRTLESTQYDAKPTPEDSKAVLDATTLANMWLDEEIAFDALLRLPQVWSRLDWLEQTFPVWQRLTSAIVTSLSTALPTLASDPDDPMAGAMAPMLRMAGAGVFASQIGRALARIAQEALSSSDVGLPLTEPPVVALLPRNVEMFCVGLEIEYSDVLLYLTLRECARQRLFRAVGWLAPQLLAYVEHYARGITFDAEALHRALDDQLEGAMDPNKLQQIGQSLAGSLFSPTVTDEQREILDRLEVLLALIEGWVDAVVGQVTKERMPQAGVLNELISRRRASATPMNEALHELFNLELRPRRVRDARSLWGAIREFRSAAARDDCWSHPDFIPTAADLDDPIGYAKHGPATPAQDDMDAALDKLLSQSDPQSD